MLADLDTHKKSGKQTRDDRNHWWLQPRLSGVVLTRIFT